MANIHSAGGGEDVIPESILSLSKDGRYIQQCQELLQELVSFVFDRKESLHATAPNPERKLELQQARKQSTWLISCLLYALVSTRTGRTLGMQATGLNFPSLATTSQSGATTGSKQGRRFVFLCLSLLSMATGSLILDYFKEDSEAEGENQEQSRGRQRRLIHERLRRQMLERAANVEGTSTAISNQPRQERNESGTGNTTTAKSAARLSHTDRFLSVYRQLSKAIFQVYSNLEGPHNIVQQTNGENQNENRGKLYTIAFWLVRLNLAHFLLTGKYPTVVHRLLGLQPRREQSIVGTTSEPKTTILDRPNTHRIIASLILLQASLSLVKGTSNWLTGRIAKFLEARNVARQRRIDQTDNTQLTKAQLRKKLDNIFGNQPAEVSKEKSYKDGDQERAILCTICRTERKHPAAPSSCGHVLCWNCLMQWVSTVRQECPICRAPCTPQDVLPLYNYKPTS